MSLLPPIACTLSAADYKTRTQWMSELAAGSLKSAEREDLTLRLVYRRDASEDVRRLISQEQTCCAFLTFDLQEDADSVLVTISAPEHACESADVLFAQFSSVSSTKDR